MKTELNQDLLRIRKEILEKSLCDSDLEKKNILDKYFCSKPSIVSYLQEKYSFSNLKVLEIGSWLGQHLFYWGSQSEGIDIQDKAVSFTNSLGFKTTKINVEEGLGFIPDQSFDAIHTNDLIEHLVSPHLFLAHCFRVLKDDGILVIGHPVVPPFFVRPIWKALRMNGWMASEHINFFTPMTINLMLTRSGFSVEEQLVRGLVRVNPSLAKIILPLSPSCLSICRKQAKFQYPPKRMAEFDPSVFREDLAVYRRGSNKM